MLIDKTYEKWGQKIGFAPKHIGNNQKLEFWLFKRDNAASEQTPYLWINVKEAGKRANIKSCENW